MSALYRRVRDCYGDFLRSEREKEIVEVTKHTYNFYGSYIEYRNIKTGKEWGCKENDFYHQFERYYEPKPQGPELELSLININESQAKFRVKQEGKEESSITIPTKDIKNIIEAVANLHHLEIKHNLR